MSDYIRYYFYFCVFQLWHRLSDWRIDIGGVANRISFSGNVHEVTIYRSVEKDRCGQVLRVIEQYDI